ncbi:hypothetical protein N656DRAFT_776549 [Canariomyces notabilis]|uniref:Uncharacterized protein n=1 Tax=Canariomyces notabilis TaxID=2074819 RepID=A0AAN6TJA4_9PEZI|nr:hypothetical protein N656DRAFT_776549 [Canariomyces arenarius]
MMAAEKFLITGPGGLVYLIVSSPVVSTSRVWLAGCACHCIATVAKLLLGNCGRIYGRRARSAAAVLRV